MKAGARRARIPLRLAGQALRDLRPRAYPVEAARTPPDGSGRYPLDLRTIHASPRLDRGGVIVIAGPDGQDYYNPVSISLYALGQHTATHLSADKNDARSSSFLAQAAQLRRTQDANGGWRYPVPVARYRMTAGWYSAMAQGLAISVLLRAYDRTGEQSFLDAAGPAASLLLRPVAAGGCSDYNTSGQPFLEECPSDPASHILNGALFALIGLRELEARTAGRAHQAASARLAAQIGEFDLGYWSRYDLRFAAPATQAYHCLHVSLLQVAGRLLTEPRFSSTAAAWRGYLHHPGYRLRAAASKARFVLGADRA